tara:strand:- start:105 stop:512 length:408 start_codon:yes stop_codon:yes gene_type:complete
MSDKWNEKKYDFGDMENAFEMGINFAVLNEKSIAKDGVDHLDAIHEAVEGSSGLRLVLIESCEVFENTRELMRANWESHDWMIAFDEFIARMFEFMWMNFGLFPAPNTGNKREQSEWRVAVMKLAVQSIRGAKHG